MKSEIPDITCLAGEPYWDGSQWRCPNLGTPVTNTTAPIRNAQGQQIFPVGTAMPVNVITSNPFISWLRSHPFVTVGGLAFLLWFFFMRGKGFASKTRTDITRWGA